MGPQCSYCEGYFACEMTHRTALHSEEFGVGWSYSQSQSANLTPFSAAGGGNSECGWVGCEA